ncbi:hypothetical protein [uncultured Muribaculum sp.]|uniref:hypothetical protein n=1 Tax=uncultured Muribaculum sp. TaxID=1918613 RepID=UPI0025B15C41|nr:hypothetical protein [uncultured Muribaculum sp.]
MKQIYACFLCVLTLPSIANAQYIVKGQVLRSDSTAIEHAVVMIMTDNRQSYYNMASTDKNGEYKLYVKKPSTYLFQFTSNESEPKFVPITVKDRETRVPALILNKYTDNSLTADSSLSDTIENEQLYDETTMILHVNHDKVSVNPDKRSIKQSKSMVQLLKRMLYPGYIVNTNNYIVDTESGIVTIFDKKVNIYNNRKLTTPEWLKNTPAEIIEQIDYTIINKNTSMPDSVKIFLSTKQ